jgi:S1-C subfamily serine protease
MDFVRTPTRLTAVAKGVVLALLAGAVPALAGDPTDAMAFVRIVGDLHTEFTDVWRNPVDEKNVEFATGSGFVIAPSGLVLTNQHVVDEAPIEGKIGGQDVEVTLENRRIEVALGPQGSLGTYEASVVASDPELDLAVLQVTASDLPYLPFGDSDAEEAGRAVRVLGFPFGRQVEVGKRREGRTGVPSPTVTMGSLSATRADDAGATRFLQTDASVNPGSSGGPMVDIDGYAVGVVRMKLARGATGSGPGFGVPINLVKDFLDAHGLLGLLPAERLYPGTLHTFDWKKLRIELPDGFEDTSPARLFVDTGAGAGGVSVQVARLATPWDLDVLDQALLQGQVWRGFAPGPVTGPRRVDRRSGRLLDSIRGEKKDGTPFRVDYTLLDLGAEKVVGRVVGPPDELAFNLSLVRRALETLDATPLLIDEVDAPLKAAFEPAPYPGAAAGRILLPSGWSREPASYATCPEVPRTDAGVAASPAGDFTVALRALRWRSGSFAPEDLARACGQPAETGGATYGRRFDRLGVVMGAWGTFVTRGDEVLLLEAEAPETKLPFVRDLYVEWTREVAEAQ